MERSKGSPGSKDCAYSRAPTRLHRCRFCAAQAEIAETTMCAGVCMGIVQPAPSPPECQRRARFLRFLTPNLCTHHLRVPLGRRVIAPQVALFQPLARNHWRKRISRPNWAYIVRGNVGSPACRSHRGRCIHRLGRHQFATTSEPAAMCHPPSRGPRLADLRLRHLTCPELP